MIIRSFVVFALAFFALAKGQGFVNYTAAQQFPCCLVDVVLLIDRGYFVNQSQFDAIFADMWTGNETGCMDIRMAAIEFGTNVSVTYWLGNFTTPTDALQALRNYTLGPYLGPDHNADLAYTTANTDVLIPENGLRMNATAFTVLFTGADPTGNQTALMDAVNITKTLATSLVVAVGNNYTFSILEQLATSPIYFFEFNTTDNANVTQNETFVVPAAICPVAFGVATCCQADVVFVIDRAYFATLNSTEQAQAILTQSFNSTDLSCPDIQVAIVEFGSNASVILYFNNFTTPYELVPYLLNYTMGPDLGPEHNVHLVYPLIRDQVFLVENGRRLYVPAVVVLITGADPTNQTLAESEAMQVNQTQSALLIVEAIGDNYTVTYLQALATSPNDFFQVGINQTGIDTSAMFTDICRLRPFVPILPPVRNVTCCPVDIIYMVDRAYANTLNESDKIDLLSKLVYDPIFDCPDVNSAVIEFGTNYTILRYLNGMYGPNMTNETYANYLMTGQLPDGMDLGTEHREEIVYPVIRNEMLSPMNGRRMDVPAVVILITGADPTNQSEAAVEAMLTGTMAIMKVLAIGSNYTRLYLRQLASLTTDFVTISLASEANMTNTTTPFDSSLLYGDVCIPRQLTGPCCGSDLVFLIDRAYFANKTNNQTFLQQLFNRTEFACSDIQVAIIEFGSNASVIIYFNNFTTNATANMTLTQYLQNYTLGPDLGPDHNAETAYMLARTDVLVESTGRRPDRPAYVILVTGTEPTNVTVALSETNMLETSSNQTTLVVQTVGTDYNRTVMEEFASSPEYFFEEANMTSNETSSPLFAAVCAAARRPIRPTTACCRADVVFLIDRAYFGATETALMFSNFSNGNLTMLQQLFNGSDLACPDIQVAIIEFGSNASVIIYFNNFTANATTNMTLAQYLQTYTLGPDLGPDHNVEMAYLIAGSQVMTPEYGRRPDVNAYVVLLTGADPTNQTAAEAEAYSLRNNATLIVEAIGTNYTVATLEPLATSPAYFFEIQDPTAGNATAILFDAVCRNITRPIPPLPSPQCCMADVVFLIDRAYFGANETMAMYSNLTNGNLSMLQQLFNSSDLACPDIQVAIIEFGSNASVIIYFNNFTSNATTNMTLAQYLQTYTLGPDLGPDHNVDLAYILTGTQVLTPEYGRRENVTAYVILLTGADPTNQTAAEAEAFALMNNATLMVEAVGDNYTTTALEALASSPQYFFQMMNQTNVTGLFDAVCRAAPAANVTQPTTAPSPSPVCYPAQFIFLIDNAYFISTQNQTGSFIIAELFRSTELSCPDVEIAIIEFGTTTNIVLYFENFTAPTTGQYLSNYTLGPYLGPEHNAHLAYMAAGTDILQPRRRRDLPVFVILTTGTTPTNETAALAEAQALEQQYNVSLVVQTVGTNFSQSVMEQLASSPQCVFVADNETASQQLVFNTTEPLYVICAPGQNVTVGENVTTTTTAPFANETTTPVSNVTTMTPPIANMTAAPGVNETTTSGVTTSTTSAVFTVPGGGVVSIEATAFCFTCQGRVNSRNLFANPTDCHSFYQCFFDNPTTARGILHQCPPGTYFHSDIYVCLPEGPVPCQDQCSNIALKCWNPPDNCAQFFTCANGASYGQCCPPETRFNPSICACEDDVFCTDTCVAGSNATNTPTVNATTLAPPTVNLTTGICTDSYGSQYQAVADQPNLFQQIDIAPRRRPRVTTFTCPPGTVFTLEACACTISGVSGPVAPSSPNQCLLYLPFDTNFEDASIYKFATFPFGNAAINSGSPAAGAGSLYVDGGRIEIPGLEAADFRDTASWCFFFRCDDPSGCTINGGLLSNNRDSTATQFSIIMAALGNNSVVARLQFREPVQSADVFGNLAGTSAGTIATTQGTSTTTGTTMTGTTGTETTAAETTTTTTGPFNETTTPVFNETTTALSNETTTALFNETTTALSNETTTAMANVTSATLGPILGATPVTISISTGTWQHVCVVMSSTSTILYLNGSPVQTVPIGGSLRIAQCPYVLGNDQAYGDFRGSIDEVLICESAFSENDVAAHLNGDKATLISQGYLPSTTQP